MTEQQIQKKILDYLNSIGKAIKLISSNEVGTPDIMAYIGGQLYLFEVKTSTGVLAPIQKVRLQQWRDNGAKAYCVRSLEEAKNAVEGVSAGDS